MAGVYEPRPSPTGLLYNALAPLTVDGLDVVTRVADRLPVDLIRELAELVERAKTAASVAAVIRVSDVLEVPDEAAVEARARLGHRSEPDTVAGALVELSRRGELLQSAADPAPLSAEQLVELEDQAARHADDEQDDRCHCGHPECGAC